MNSELGFSHRESNLKERISDVQLGNLLAAFGNSEAKSGLLVVMGEHPMDIFDASRLSFLMKASQTPNTERFSEGWQMHDALPTEFCKKSLEPIGLVAHELVDHNDNKYGYQITKLGIDKGVPLAGLLLDFSEKNDTPLYHLFGNTSSVAKTFTERTPTGVMLDTKVRPPAVRLNLYKQLLSSTKPLRRVEILSQVGGISDPTALFSELEWNGIINYDEDSPTRVGESNAVFISLSDQQREKLDKLVEILDKYQMQDPDYLKEGGRLARDYATDPMKMRSVLSRARKASFIAGKPEPGEIVSIIEAVIKETDILSTNEIQNKLRSKGVQISRSHVLRYLRRMRDNGMIISNTGKQNSSFWQTK